MCEKFRPAQESNHDLRDAGAVLNQVSYQANLKLVIKWVLDDPVL